MLKLFDSFHCLTVCMGTNLVTLGNNCRGFRSWPLSEINDSSSYQENNIVGCCFRLVTLWEKALSPRHKVLRSQRKTHNDSSNESCGSLVGQQGRLVSFLLAYVWGQIGVNKKLTVLCVYTNCSAVLGLSWWVVLGPGCWVAVWYLHERKVWNEQILLVSPCRFLYLWSCSRSTHFWQVLPDLVLDSVPL